MSKKRSLLKTIASGVLAVGLIGGACATAYHFKDNIKDWIHPNDDVEDNENLDDNDKNTAVYVDGVEIDGNNASVNYVPQSIAFTKANNRASSGNTLSFTANVIPSYATNQSITWSLAWNGTNSNNVNDYVTLTSTNNGKNVSLTCIKGFNTQIKLTGKTTDGATASTTIDLLKYIDGVDFYTVDPTSSNDGTKLTSISLSYQQNYTYESTNLFDLNYLSRDTDIMDSLYNCGIYFKYNTVGTVGTISTNYYYETYDDFYSYCYNKGLETLDDAACILKSGESSYKWKVFDSLGNMAGNDGFIVVCGSVNGISDYEFMKILSDYGENAIEYYGEFTTTYGNYSTTQHIGCTFGFKIGYIKSTGITINGSGVFA